MARRAKGEGCIRRRKDRKKNPYEWKIIEDGVAHYEYAPTRALLLHKIEQYREAQKEAAEAKAAPPEPQLFADYARTWLANKNKLKSSSRYRYNTNIESVLIPAFGSDRLSDLTEDRLRVFLSGLEKDHSYNHYMNVRGVLNSILKHAAQWDGLPENPLPRIEHPRKPKAKVVSLTAEQTQCYLDGLSGHEHEALFSLMYFTGLRVAEVCALRWRSFSLADPQRAFILVEHSMERTAVETIGTPKSDASHRRLPIHPDLYPILVRQKRAHEERVKKRGEEWSEDRFVFPGSSQEDKPIITKTVWRRLKAYLKQRGLPPVSPHKIRHTFATQTLEGGVDLKTVQQFMGHSNIQTTAIYLHPSHSFQQEMMSRLKGFSGDRNKGREADREAEPE